MNHETQTVCRDQVELYFADLDTHVLVENLEGRTVIRATRDNFTGKRKAMFIRELAAEGHIPDRYQWFFEPNSIECPSVKWVIDRSWVALDPEVRGRAERHVLGVILGSSLFLLLLILVLCH